jgi:pyrroloquinoline-quinone synthase
MNAKHEETLRRIEAIHRAKPRAGHPLWEALQTGKLSKAQVQEHVKQFSIIPLYNHLYHGRLYVICPDPEWRSMLAEVCYEEGTGRLFAGGISHHFLYLRLGEALGISKEEMYATKFCPEALAMRSYFEYICSKNILEGVAGHMLGAEAQVPGNSGRTGIALQMKFGLSDEDIAFYTVHEEADEEHTSIGLRLLERFAERDEDLELVVQTVQDMVDVHYVFFDGIYKRVQAIQ